MTVASGWLPRCVVLLVAWAVVPFPRSAGADDERPDPIAIREVEFPLGAGGLANWLDAGWVPVSEKRYREFRERLRANARESPSAPRLGRATYRATYSDGTFVDGTFTAELRVPDDSPQPWIVDLGQPTVALGDVESDDDAVSVGLTDRGRVIAHTTARETTIRGRWSLRGRKVLRAHEFDVVVPEASVSTLRLRLPDGMVLETGEGVVQRAENDSNEWVVELGASPRCRLRVAASSAAEVQQPITLVRRRVELSVQPDSIGFRVELELNPVQTPLRSFRLAIPRRSRIERVELGSGTPLAWTTTGRGASNLNVQLPDPLTGPGRRVVVVGRMPLDLDVAWSLPRFRLGGPSATFLDERSTFSVSVASPLQLDTESVVGMRRVAPTVAVAEGEVLAFEETSPDAEIVARVSYPDLVARARSVTFVDTRADEWLLRSVIRWEARSGQTYELGAEVPRGWRVSNVLVDQSDDADRNWRIRRGLAGIQTVTTGTRDALSPGHPRTLVIEATFDTARAGRTVVHPVVRPLGCKGVDSVLIVVGPTGWVPSLLAGSDFSPVDLDALDAGHVDLLNRLDLPEADALHVFHSRKMDGRAQIDGRRESGRIAVTTRFDLGTDGRPVVRTTFECPGGDVPEVSLGVDPRDLSWSVVGENGDAAEVDLEWTPLEEASKRRSWQLKIDPPPSGPFVLQADGLVVADEFGAISLPDFPDADFDGHVAFTAAALGRMRPRFSGPATRTSGGATPAEWAYAGAIDVRWETEVARDAPPVPVADVDVHTTLGTTEAAHTVVLTTVPDGRSRRFSFELPERASLVQCQVDGRPAPARRDGNSYHVALPTGTRSHRVTLLCRAPVATGAWRTSVGPLLPETPTRMRTCRWHVSDSPGWMPVAGPSAREALAVHWTRRLFGPLGRPAGMPLFNPLVPSTWGVQDGSADAEQSDAGRVWSETIVPGDGARFVFVDRVPLESVAWFVLIGTVLFGLVARLLGGESSRRRLLPVVVCLALVVWLLPPDLGIVVGGLIAGGVLALLIPSPLVHWTVLRRDESGFVSEGSTLSFRHAPRVLVLAAALLGTSLIADDVTGPGDASSAPSPGDVLVPTTNSGDRPGVVYVSPAVRDLVEETERVDRDRDRYVLESAVYEASFGDRSAPEVVARFRLRLLAASRPIAVELPVRAANVSGREPCTVNGRPSPVEPGRNPESVLVELGEDVRGEDRVEIVLVLHPAVAVESEQSSFTVPTPRVPWSELRVEANALSNVEIDGAVGEANVVDGVAVWSLGPLSRFGVRWGERSSTEPRLATRPFDLHALHTVSPVLLRTQCRFAFDGTPPVRETLVWTVPPRFGVRSVAGSPGVRTERVVEGGVTRVYAHLGDAVPTAEPSAIVVTMDLVSAPEVGDDGEIVLPGTGFLVPDDLADRTTFVARDRRVGVTTSSEWEVVLRNGPGGMRALDPDEFSASAPGWNVPTPRAALESTGETPAFVLLDPRRSRRLVRELQRFHVGAHESNWSYRAEIVVDAAPVFEHRLRVPRSMEVESVSLIASDVERVARWTREGREILVELTERSIGPQRLRVTGWMPVDLEEPFELPRVELLDSEIEESEVVVAHAADVKLELADGPLVPKRLVDVLEESQPAGSEILGRFDLRASEGPLVLRASLEEVPLRVVSESRLRRDEGASWLLETRLAVTDASRTTDRLEIRLPAGFSLMQTMVDESRVRMFPAGSGSLGGLTLVPVGAGRERFEVTLAGVVEEPSDDTWTLETPSIETPAAKHRLLVESDQWLPTDEYETDGPGPGFVSGPSATWQLERTGDRSGHRARVSLLETRLTFDGRGSLRGRTLLFVRGQPDAIDVEWSSRQSIETIAVDGTAVPVARRSAGRDGSYTTTVPIRPDRSRSVVRVDWSVEDGRFWPVVRRDVPLPRVIGAEVDRSLVAVEGAATSRTRLGGGGQELEAADYELEWIDGVLEPTSNASVVPNWLSSLLRERISRTEELVLNDASREEVAALREDRLERARERLAAARVVDGGDGEPRVDTYGGALLATVRTGPDVDRIAIGLVPWWTTWFLVGLVAVPVVLLGWRWVSRREWSFAAPDSLAATCAVAGIVWWSCLRLGGFGLVLLAASTWLLVAERRRPHEDRSEIVV